jgi:hypothetical protein
LIPLAAVPSVAVALAGEVMVVVSFATGTVIRETATEIETSETLAMDHPPFAERWTAIGAAETENLTRARIG